MNSIADRLRAKTWASVSPVTGVTPDTIAHRKPKQEEGYVRSSLGYYGPSNRPVTPVTRAIPPSSMRGMGDARSASPPRSAGWFADLPRVVLDIETYYDRAYSLKKLDIVTYTLDPRFRLHGIAVHYPDGHSEFHTDARALISDLRRAYGEQLERAVVVFHNAYFDYFVLYERFGLMTRHIVDTMLLSRLLHGAVEDHDLEDVAARYDLPAKGDLEFMAGVVAPNADELERLRTYALNDVRITAALADHLIPLASALPIELWAADHAVRMFVERPLPVDGAQVKAAQKAFEASIANTVSASGLDEKTIRSTKAFPAALRAALARTGRNLPTKPGKKGALPAISKKDRAQALLLSDPDPVVRALMAAKVAVASAANSRARLSSLGAMAARAAGGKGHFLHSYHRAVTGRYAGKGGFNIQNMKHPGSDASAADVAACIRRAIGAPEDNVLVSADASQIEARVLAYLAGQRDLHDAFACGRDIYSEFASEQLRREVRKPGPQDAPEQAAALRTSRQIGKQAILGLGYGMGADKFINELRSKPEVADLFDAGSLNDATCAAVVYGYRDRYPHIRQFWRDCEDAVRSAMLGVPAEVSRMFFHVQGGVLRIRLLSGRELVYPGIREQAPTYTTTNYTDRHGVKRSVVDDHPGIIYGSGFKLYGGKIVENIVQGTGRDLLVDVMFRLESAGFLVVHHCHDSVTVAVPESQDEEVRKELMDAWRAVPGWAAGLVLDAETKSGRTLEAV